MRHTARTGAWPYGHLGVLCSLLTVGVRDSGLDLEPLKAYSADIVLRGLFDTSYIDHSSRSLLKSLMYTKNGKLIRSKSYGRLRLCQVHVQTSDTALQLAIWQICAVAVNHGVRFGGCSDEAPQQ